jgi:hypothetical protein
MLAYGGNHLTILSGCHFLRKHLKNYLDRWSHAKSKYKERTKCLFSCGNYILQVHLCIQIEKVIVYNNPSCMHNFINVNLVKWLQVHEKNIQGT